MIRIACVRSDYGRLWLVSSGIVERLRIKGSLDGRVWAASQVYGQPGRGTGGFGGSRPCPAPFSPQAKPIEATRYPHANARK